MPLDRPNPPKDRVRVEHMLAAAREALHFAQGRTRESLDTDRLFERALIHAIMEIGEAAARTTEAGRSRVPTLPWGQIVQMRHTLVHVYWGVDRDKLWRTLTDDLPPLVSALELALSRWPADLA